jgi:ketosteroid isomerase-like protein
MSEQANLQVLKDAYAAFLRGDIQSVLDACADDIEWESPGPSEIPYAGLFHGKDGVADFFNILFDTDDIQLFEPETFLAQGDRVVVLGHYSARVKATGRSTQADWVHSFVMRDGKVTKFREYYDTALVVQAYHAATAGV